MRHHRVARRAAVVAALAAASVAATAAPAAAHGVGGLEPTNYETRVLRVVPDLDGIQVASVDLGERLELTNDTNADVVVLGYDGEPYLRVGPRGAFVNDRSPARYINRTLRGTSRVPASADPDAAPEWRRIDDGTTVRWHDHRAHWMGDDDPPAVRDDPGAPHLVQPFRVQLRTHGETVRVFGDVRWVPPPSPWPWLGGAAALAIALIALALRRRLGLAIALGLGLLIGAQVLHVVGLWGASTASTGSKLGASAYSLGGIALAVIGLVLLARRGARAAVPVALLGGLFLALAGGLADVTTLSRSQVPSTLPAWLDRLSVTVTIGAGIGLAVAAGLELRRERREGMVPTPLEGRDPSMPSAVGP
jgi:hypothetical protein